ncbi:MAG: hypothetical protein WDA10_14665 [Porticoccaceae bacterium]
MSNRRRSAALVRLHRRLAWLGGIALVVFGLSGLSHPLMTWFGPQQAAFFPPQGLFDGRDIAAIPAVLAANGIQRAQQVKVMPTPEGNLLQVSGEGGILRRYFNLTTGAELPEFDRRQGEWLARHYTGRADTPIRAIQLQTTFDDAYPAVNRLLPVWRVDFVTDDNLSAFVHTELNALAALTNDTRTLQQTLFQVLHTWRWLDRVEPARVLALLVLVGALAALCLVGLALLVAMPRRDLKGARRWHRALALAIWLPLLAFALSGLLHLLHNAGGAGDGGFRHGPPLALDAARFGGASGELDALADRPLNSITLVAGPSGEILYRLGEPAGQPGQAVTHHGRFAGTPTEKPARLIDAASGAVSALDDEALARLAAARHLGIPPDSLGASTPVTAFGPDYDFRNKRLPVWRVEHTGGSVFIDPANGALVDSASRADRIEGLSFSHLHKWNFLTPLVGRQGRDGLAVAVILLALGLAGLGAGLMARRRRA